MNIKEEAAKMKLASPLMASASAEKRNSALLHMIENLEAGKEKIFAANGIDLAAAKASGLAPALMKRLAFDEGKLADSISGIRQIISLPDPVGKVTLARQLDEGLRSGNDGFAGPFVFGGQREILVYNKQGRL